ncbi:MAG: F-type H+-transporting ATPase subunit epsilon [Neolewinella sp.]|jgi:F-type H+-transporting ATPase subunit epsilon|nr:F0F1 ATP synthase subunit epsilon [Lewinella sp.]
MNISVLTPDRTIFTGNITNVVLPGVEGSFQLLDNHAPLVSALSGGKVTLQTTDKGEYRFYDEEAKAMSEVATSSRFMTFTIDRGFVEVLNNEVNLLVQGARNLR